MRSALKLAILLFPFWVILRSILFIIAKDNFKFSWLMELLYSVCFMYFVALISITLLDFRLGTGFAVTKAYTSNYLRESINLIPFRDTIEMFRIAIAKNNFFFIRWALLNVIGNGILLLPLGFFLPILNTKYKSFRKIFVTALIITFSIEFLQFVGTYLNIFFRTVDIDDIILNTLGAVLGYYIFVVLNKILDKYGFKI